MTTVPSFQELALSNEVLGAISAVGYEHPSPIQAQSIPQILSGRDIIGQAQTGTGKTAAFALPILTNLDLTQKDPQVLVLAPTRELAIQVAEAFQTYAAKLQNFHVQPIYGGQDYSVQLRSLRRGVHVVVGTPGRVMDHIRRGTLKLGELKHLVLDEADEMLRMGFLDDVKWILDFIPKERQISLFSATMPVEVKRIAEKYLVDPKLVQVKSKASTADTVRQRYWIVRKVHKLDALTRMLEAEAFEAALVFVRTKSATLELAERLRARGFAADPLNGDISQGQREKTVAMLKKGTLDIIVATDVAARGLDVERISHVINYDIPFDTESYVHRIGRTGRAGRTGDAILFVSPREQRMLRAIEQATRTKITEMELPTKEDVTKRRCEEFKRRISETVLANDLDLYAEVVQEYVSEQEIPIERVAAALAKLAHGERPLGLETQVHELKEKEDTRGNRPRKSRDGGRKSFKGRGRETGRRDGARRDSRKIEDGRRDSRSSEESRTNDGPKRASGSSAGSSGAKRNGSGRSKAERKPSDRKESWSKDRSAKPKRKTASKPGTYKKSESGEKSEWRKNMPAKPKKWAGKKFAKKRANS